MSHECLFVSDREGPYQAQAGGTASIAGWPHWTVFLPAGSIYIGKALRFRASGIIGVSGVSGQTLRPLVAFITAAPTTTQQTMVALFTNPVVQWKQTTTASWSFDATMVCRSTTSTLTTWMLGGWMSSCGIIGGIQGQNDCVQPAVVTPPVVSTGAMNCNVDNWLALTMSSTPSLNFEYKVQNYRVDAIA